MPGSVYERGEAGVHNTALAISPEGELVATYRKAFPWQPHERTEPGDRFVVFEIPDVARVGLAICYDGFFPEVFRQLAWLGAEIVIQPTLTTTSDRAAELITARANAIVNQLYVVNVNAAAPAALGRSLVIDPEGLVRVEAGATEELITDVLDLEAVERVRSRNRGRVSDVGADRPGRRIRRRAADVRGWPYPATTGGGENRRVTEATAVPYGSCESRPARTSRAMGSAGVRGTLAAQISCRPTGSAQHQTF